MEKITLMTPGKDNHEDRLNFVKFWANYIKNNSDKEWSKQQRMLIDSQFVATKQFYKELSKTKEGRERLEKIKTMKINKK